MNENLSFILVGKKTLTQSQTSHTDILSLGSCCLWFQRRKHKDYILLPTHIHNFSTTKYSINIFIKFETENINQHFPMKYTLLHFPICDFIYTCSTKFIFINYCTFENKENKIIYPTSQPPRILK